MSIRKTFFLAYFNHETGLKIGQKHENKILTEVTPLAGRVPAYELGVAVGAHQLTEQ